MRRSTAGYPETFDQLEKAIIEQFPSLSKRLQQIASHALDNPSELALETIAAVGHEPQLGLLVSWLLAGGEESFVELREGGACLLEFDALPGAGRGRLAWLAGAGGLGRARRLSRRGGGRGRLCQARHHRHHRRRHRHRGPCSACPGRMGGKDPAYR